MNLWRRVVRFVGSHPVVAGALTLRDSALCLDCEAVFPMRKFHCPGCGSASWMSLSRVLNRQERWPGVPIHDEAIYRRVEELSAEMGCGILCDVYIDPDAGRTGYGGGQK